MNSPNTFPIAFSIKNTNDENVLYTLGDPENLDIEITNEISTDLQITSRSGGIAANNYHYGIFFRLGVLDHPENITCEAEGEEADQWGFLYEFDHIRELDCFYLMRKTVDDFIANSTVVFQLNNVKARGQEGSRGTNVLLDYRNLESSGRAIEGQRQSYLSILNTAPVDLFAVSSLADLQSQIDDLRENPEEADTFPSVITTGGLSIGTWPANNHYCFFWRPYHRSKQRW